MLKRILKTTQCFLIYWRDLSFFKWISIFGFLGLVVPAVYLALNLIFGIVIGGSVLARSWPTSLVFMGLDTPSPSLFSIILTFAIAVLGNVLIYALLGLITWPIIIALRFIIHRHRE